MTDADNEEIVESLKRGQKTALELRVATALCQNNRVIRSMPSAEEIRRALPMAKSIITDVLDTCRMQLTAIENQQYKQMGMIVQARDEIWQARKMLEELKQ